MITVFYYIIQLITLFEVNIRKYGSKDCDSRWPDLGLLENSQIPILKSILIETEPMILDIQGKQPLNACAYMYVFTKLNVFVWLFEVFLENYPMNIPTMYGSYWVKVIVFNTTFNISVISWRPVLLLQETGVPLENHRPVANHWQTKLYRVHLAMSGFQLVSGIKKDDEKTDNNHLFDNFGLLFVYMYFHWF